jgi:transcriptional regulator with XRE-family HTH domain
MKKSSKDVSKEINSFFEESPTLNQKAWGVINQFYHIILTYMDENKISPANLAKELGVSRSAISQLFSKTPNISVKKMVEIADAIGIKIEITSPQVVDHKRISYYENIIEKIYPVNKGWIDLHYSKGNDNIILNNSSEKESLTIPATAMDGYTPHNIEYN